MTLDQLLDKAPHFRDYVEAQFPKYKAYPFCFAGRPETKIFSERDVFLALHGRCKPNKRNAGERREVRPTHPALVADGRHPPRERRAGTPSQRRSILGSLLAEKAKKPSLSSSYRSKNRIFT